jgi:hypothetical protein
MNDLVHYDIIGDIHGRFDKLTALMERLGYEKDEAGFTPPAGHRALFLGDLIDPKPSHPTPGGVRATLHAVKAMHDRGDALCLMGNHELNAIFYHTDKPGGDGLRRRGPRNTRMHRGTLDDFPDYKAPGGEWLTEWIPWMKRLPFYLDFGNFRAVHAAWHPEFIERVKGRSLLDESFLIAAADHARPEGEALEALLKGIEVELPPGTGYYDHTGTFRKNIRARWWELPDSGIGYDGLVFPAHAAIPDEPVRADSFAGIPGYPLDAPPVFFGHYFKPAHAPLRPERHNVACLDHAAAMDGPLVAYRWRGEDRILPEHYLSCHLS